MSMPAIKVVGLTKDFEVYDKPSDIALEILTRKKRHRTFKALDDISFEVEHGEVLGIIGSNGAGKSTLLKIITGVLDPTAGSIEISGKVTAILELGLGFNMEYTGRENIRLSGLLYGMTQDEVERKLDSIIDFSGLADFIELPIKTYSSGMFARLAFSIATAADPEILIIDEALAAGDAMFVQKCLRRIREFCNSGRTVLLVSHGTGLLAQLCKRVIWLDKGKLQAVGPALSVIQAYDMAAHAGADSKSWVEDVPVPSLADGEVAAVQKLDTDPAVVDEAAAIPGPAKLGGMQGGSTKKVLKRGPFFIESVDLLDGTGKRTTTLVTTQPFSLAVHYKCAGEIPKGTLGVAVAVNRLHDLAPVTQWFTQNIMPNERREDYDNAIIRITPARQGTILLGFPYTPYCAGEYILSIGLLANEPANWEFYEYRHLWYPFSVDDGGLGVGAPMFFRPSLVHSKIGELSIPAKPQDESSEAELAPDAAPGETADPALMTTLREEINAICLGKGGYPESWPKHDSCPCCGGGPLRPAFSKFKFEHKKCDACNFVCVDPYPPSNVVEELYRGQYYTKVRELFELPRVMRGEQSTPFSAPRETLLEIIRHITVHKFSGRWLDVGGGLGAFANLIAQGAPSWDVMLNEFNLRSLEIAADQYKLKTTTSTADALFAQGERFDAITSVAVLEHIANPFAFLTGYARLLKPGGSLVTVVPNFTRLSAEVSRGSSASVAPPFHLSLFNKDNLRLILERIETLTDVCIEEAGPPAFSLIHHIDYGDRWDISIPSPADPEPRGILLEPYDSQQAQSLNALAEADPKLSEYFSETDGKMLLVAYARAKG